jgi:hypothetical protein
MKVEYILTLQRLALSEVLSENPSFQYFYRRTCRQYSELFHTPLPQVYDLPFDEVLTNVSEHRLESQLQSEDGEDDLLLQAHKIVDPTFEQEEEEDAEEFYKKVLEEENLKKARALSKQLQGDGEPQPSSEERSAQPPVGNSMTFEEDVPPEAVDYDPISELDDLF